MSREYVKDEEILETRWKCPSCETVNRGRDLKCTSCGAPKDESSEYQVDESGAPVDDAEALADAEAGENWTCAYCEKENRSRKRICAFCGADQTRKDRKPPAPQPAPAPKGRSSVLLGCGIALAVVVALVAFFAWLGSPKHEKAKVVSLEWEQAVHVERRTEMHKSGWRDEVPGDAFASRCERRQRTTREVVDHYRSVTRTRSVKYQSGSHEVCRTETTNLRNGYAKRQQICHNEPDYAYRDETYTDQEPVYRTEPVYDDMCQFSVYEWPVVQTAKRSGSGTSGLAWPPDSEALAAAGANACVPCPETASHPEATLCCAREAHYRVHFQNPKKAADQPTYEAKTPEEFATFAVGQTRELVLDGDKVSLAPTKK